MNRNLRLAVERVNAWHLARVLARTASEADVDTPPPDAALESQPANPIADPAVSLDGAPVEEPASIDAGGHRRMH